MKDKTITVTAMWRETMSRWQHGSKVPALRMSGEWLRDAGFTEGAKVTVAAERGRLVLTVAE